jgi:hypothetical protein
MNLIQSPSIQTGAFVLVLLHSGHAVISSLLTWVGFVGLAYEAWQGYIVFRFIIEYNSSLRDFGPY